MIPKIIHYTWFSGEQFPDKIKECINSWQKYMPEYEYVLWDSERIKEIKSRWLEECLQKKKWAFAADFVRLYAVYNYGGIYLDTDCIVYQSFDPLLNNVCFIGKEHSIHIEGRRVESYLSSHCFGAEAGNSFIYRCLSYYDRPFVMSDNDSFPMRLKWNTVLLPFIQSELAKQSGYCPSPSSVKIQNLAGGGVVYPSEYFDSSKITSNSFCKHLALGSWRDEKSKEEKITLWYKVRWRVESVLRAILNKCGYLLIKKC